MQRLILPANKTSFSSIQLCSIQGYATGHFLLSFSDHTYFYHLFFRHIAKMILKFMQMLLTCK